MMMHRSTSKDSLIGAGAGGRNHNNIHNAMTNGTLSHRRGMPFAKNNSGENFNSNNNADLFSRNRAPPSSEESDLQVRLARLSVGSAKPAKSILDDLLSSNEGGKNDYDWLLTPPGTPLFPSSDGKEPQPPRVTTRSKSSVRSSSINKSSRLSVSQSETTYPSTRPTRSSSATRSSISTTQYTNHSNRNINTNILNTSSASVSSYIRPSTPPNRSSTSARPSTPSRTRPSPTNTSTNKTTRPSTPSSRPQTPGNSQPTRPVSKPSGGRGPGSRPSSPSSRVRPPPQPINLLDFPHETPPNLRTTLPDRPLSAGRSRPSASATAKGSLEASNTNGTITRRHSSPIVTRGRLVDPTGRGRVVENLEPRKTSHLPESLNKKPVKLLSSESGAGFGRNISKKSLDMAVKHMDIRNGSARALSGSTIFPQSIRSSNTRTQPGRTASAPGSIEGSANNGYQWNRGQPVDDQSPHSSKLSSEVVDIYESSRYDAILLKEDLQNTSWLHSADDKIGDGLLFDNGFEPLPEPFGPL